MARVLLDDASADTVYSRDEYVQRNRSKSVLCLPVVKQTKLVGALYLENKLTPGAFTPDRPNAMLAARAAIDMMAKLGELLPLTKTEYVTGAESQKETAEPHAPATAQPANHQAFTWCFAVDYLDGEDHTIPRPATYPTWRKYVPRLTPPWTGPLLSWKMSDPIRLQAREVSFTIG